jgi:hypothetical protein
MNTITARAVRACLDADVPVLLWGLPGIGKSSALKALAARRGQHIEIVIGSLREPSDFCGLPVVSGDDSVSLAPPGWAKRLAAAGGGMLVLDELSTAPPAVQKAMLGVVFDRVVGDLALPAGVSVIAAANPAECAADGWELAAPLANRFCHLDVEAGVEEFCDGLTLGWDNLAGQAPSAAERVDPSPAALAAARAAVAGFIKHRPNLLIAMPDNAAAAGKAWPSPRTWEMAAAVAARLGPDDTEAALVVCTGLVGRGAAVEYFTWLAAADLPDPEAVLDDPAIVAWNGRADRIYAVLSGVIAVVAANTTLARWNKGWKVLAASADGGRAVVGAAAARALMRCRPQQAPIPNTVMAFMPVLAAAGLVEQP